MGKKKTQQVDDTIETSSTTSSSFFNLSGSGWTRHEEKEQLSHLNDRLAGYINRVRQLEKENTRLNMTLKETEILENRDRKALEEQYLREIAELRHALDDASTENARLKIENDRLRAEWQEISDKLKRLEPALERAEANLESQRNLVYSLSNRNKSLEEESKSLKDDVKRFKKERDEAINEKNIAKKQLEEETLIRSQAENRVLSLREELRFEKERHKQTVQEMKEKRETEISLTTRDLEEQYESKLAEMLRDARAELEGSFVGRAKSDRDSMRDLNNQVNKLTSERGQYLSELETMRLQLSRAEDSVEHLRRDYEARLRARDEEATRLRNEVDRLSGEYNDLLEIKIKLDMEIAAYRMLLEEEESRLHLSSEMKSSSKRSASSNTSRLIEDITTVAQQEGTPGRHGIKRRRVQISDIQDEIKSRGLRVSDFDREAKAYHDKQWSNIHGLKIEHDHVGAQWVKIRNDSDEDIALGGWSLMQEAAGHKTKYKFASRQLLPAGQTLTIYSVNAREGETSSQLHTIRMKKEAWQKAPVIHTTLTTSDAAEVAYFTTDSTIPSLVRGHAIEGEEGDQRCVIM